MVKLSVKLFVESKDLKNVEKYDQETVSKKKFFLDLSLIFGHVNKSPQD